MWGGEGGPFVAYAIARKLTLVGRTEDSAMDRSAESIDREGAASIFG